MTKPNTLNRKRAADSRSSIEEQLMEAKTGLEVAVRLYASRHGALQTAHSLATLSEHYLGEQVNRDRAFQ